MAYDQTIHPQKRLDMKGALEACMGRMLEVKHWLVNCCHLVMRCFWLSMWQQQFDLTPDDACLCPDLQLYVLIQSSTIRAFNHRF